MAILKGIFSIFLAFSFLPNSSIAGEKIIVVSDICCPYVCDNINKQNIKSNTNTNKFKNSISGDEYNPGFLVEIMQKAFSKTNIEIEHKFMPWTDATKFFAEGKADALIATNDEYIEAEFPSIPQVRGFILAYTNIDENWVYKGYNSLVNRKIGIVEGYNHPNSINKYLFSYLFSNPDLFVFINSINPIEKNINNLISGKIFMFAEDENVVNFYTNTNQINKIKEAGEITNSPRDLYIVFSKKNNNAKKYSRLITQEMIKLKMENRLKSLMKKYNIKEYKNYDD